MTQFPETRRHRDGSIDFDFYRTQAVAARGEMLRNAFKLKATFGFTLITLTTATVCLARGGSRHDAIPYGPALATGCLLAAAV